MRMKARIRKMWCEKLRSGEVKQGRKCLRSSGDEFCCLGVLGYLWLTRAREGRKSQWSIRDKLSRYSVDGSSVALGDRVQEWAGLSSAYGGRVEIEGEMKDLDDHNDYGRTFAEIADAIEEQL